MSEPQSRIYSRDFVGDIEGVSQADAWLAGQLGALGLGADAKYAITLCMEELFLNAVQHGHANRATISVWAESNGARLEFVDDGAPFDPTIVAAKRIARPTADFEIGGYGTGLVQKFARRIRYHRSDGQNRLLLEFDAGAPPSPILTRSARQGNMVDSFDLHAAVRATSAFRDLSDASVEFLIGAAELETFDPGATLMTQGEPGDHALLILAGEVTVTADSPRGAIPVSTLKAPSLVGETGALAKLPRTATARARTAVSALRIGRRALIEVARATPSLLIDVVGRMGDRMRKVNSAISLYTHALAALERDEFDSALLEELRNPIPDLADFGQTFGRMAEQIILRRQRSDEMASAAVIQRALLPKVGEFAAEFGLDIYAAMTPARDIGGDFFDLIELGDGRIAFGVGDVCGKGVPAALFMGITRTLIRINLRETPDLHAAILRTNAYLTNNNSAELFATLLYAAFDPSCGEIEYCSCGHLPALLRRAGGAVEKLPAGGLPVGMFDQLKPKVRRTAMGPGDLLFLYTDGVTEAADGEAREFGEERLLALLAQSEPANAAQWIARVDAAVRQFSQGQAQFDDITCLALLR